MGRYRDFDPLGFAAFSWALRFAVGRRGQLAREVLESGSRTFDLVRLRFELDDRSIVTGLYEVTLILGKGPREQAELFKEVLVSEIGAGVARARGRYGQVISEDDERTLAYASEFLTA